MKREIPSWQQHEHRGLIRQERSGRDKWSSAAELLSSVSGSKHSRTNNPISPCCSNLPLKTDWHCWGQRPLKTALSQATNIKYHRMPYPHPEYQHYFSKNSQDLYIHFKITYLNRYLLFSIISYVGLCIKSQSSVHLKNWLQGSICPTEKKLNLCRDRYLHVLMCGHWAFFFFFIY